jgi:indolepyruvate ferredoxin oxidoreductase beta subunit
VITGEDEYPAPQKIREAVTSLSALSFFLDATDEAVKLGNPILGNIVMIGAIVGLGVLPVDRKVFETVIREEMPASRVQANLHAFAIGMEAVTGAAKTGR